MTYRKKLIEVEGGAEGARTVTITRNEIVTALNKPEEYVLGVVQVNGETPQTPRYIRRLFQRDPDFGVESINYDLRDLLLRAEEPR